MLAANGYYEIQTNSLTKPVYAQNAPFLNEKESVEILNKLSEDLGVLRQSLLYNGLEVIAYNINRKQKDLKLFEFGKSYRKKGPKYEEIESLSIWATGNYETENWRAKTRPIDFYDFYEVVLKIINKFTRFECTSKPLKDEIFIVGLQLFVEEEEIARFGKLQKSIIKQTGVNQDVFYSNIDYNRLLFGNAGEFKFKEISKYPEVRRDLSLVIDKKVTFEEIKNILKRKDFFLLKNVNVFDYYEGESIGSDKKAYALSFILQDESKTLTDQVIDKVMNRLIEVYETELGAVIRK